MLAMTEALFWTGAALDAAATAAHLHPQRAGRLLGTTQPPAARQGGAGCAGPLRPPTPGNATWAAPRPR